MWTTEGGSKREVENKIAWEGASWVVLLTSCYLLPYLLHGAESFLRTGFQLVKKFPTFYGKWRFITTFTSASHLSLCPVYAPPSHFLNIHLIIIFPSKYGSSKWTLSFRFSHQIPVCTSLLLHMCYIPRPSHSSWFVHPNNIWWGVQVINP